MEASTESQYDTQRYGSLDSIISLLDIDIPFLEIWLGTADGEDGYPSAFGRPELLQGTFLEVRLVNHGFTPWTGRMEERGVIRPLVAGVSRQE